jgi:hypothetical protein
VILAFKEWTLDQVQGFGEGALGTVRSGGMVCLAPRSTDVAPLFGIQIPEKSHHRFIEHVGGFPLRGVTDARHCHEGGVLEMARDQLLHRRR